jgi:hypothetical protein
MNAHQRRRLKRIRLRQRDSAARKLNRADTVFVIAHTPGPKNVCMMSPAESMKFHQVSIAHRCTSTAHRHYSRKHVDILVERGDAEWVGGHNRVAAWTVHRTWQKAPSGPVTVMQLLPGLRR